MSNTISVYDRDGEIILSQEDLRKYATNENIIAAALMFRICQCAFRQLSPSRPVFRRELYWQIGFPGPGILDCIEMISHAVREGRCLQNPTFSHPKADPPKSLLGHFLFEISYRGKSIVIWPDKAVFDDEFRHLVSTWQYADENNEGYQNYLMYKAKKVKQIMSMTEEQLLHFEILCNI